MGGRHRENVRSMQGVFGPFPLFIAKRQAGEHFVLCSVDCSSDPGAAAHGEAEPTKTVSGLAVGHCGYAQPPAPVVPALRAPPTRTPHTPFWTLDFGGVIPR